MAIGSLTPYVVVPSLLGNAQDTAALMETMLLQAHHIARSVASGWHGRRRQGTGDSFWQFRSYQPGESTTHIDWRRSARGNTFYIREREWEAAQTVFLCPDLSPSMCYQSRFALHSKEAHAILLTLTLAELLSKAGERIAVPHLFPPTLTRYGAEKVALALHATGEREKSFDLGAVHPHARAIIISDFLDDTIEREKKLIPLIKHHVKAHLIEVADRAEMSFPYRGSIVFHPPQGGEKIRLERAEHLVKDYKTLYLARRVELNRLAQKYSWSFYSSITDTPLAPTLHHLYLALAAIER